MQNLVPRPGIEPRPPELELGVLSTGPQRKSHPTTYLFFFLFIYLVLAVLGLHCCAWAFSSCGKRGLLFVVVRRLLTAVASLVAEHRL